VSERMQLCRDWHMAEPSAVCMHACACVFGLCVYRHLLRMFLDPVGVLCMSVSVCTRAGTCVNLSI
jgi:hypothetical protein